MASSGGSVKPGSNRDINRGSAFEYGRGEALAKHRNRQFMAQQLKKLRGTARGGVLAAPSSQKNAAKVLAGYSAGMKQRRVPAGSPAGGQFKAK